MRERAPCNFKQKNYISFKIYFIVPLYMLWVYHYLRCGSMYALEMTFSEYLLKSYHDLSSQQYTTCPKRNVELT